MRSFDVTNLPTRFFNPGELETYLRLVEQYMPEIVVEFGVHRGRNAAAVLRNFPEVKQYVGVDVTPGYTTAMACQRKEVPVVAGDLARHDRRFKCILKRRGSYDLTPSDLPKAQMVFIDGDHSREGVLNDYRLARAICGPGSIILFHDDNGLPEVQVTETLEELRAEGRVITHIPGTWFALEVLE